MQVVAAGQPFCFNYTAFDENASLFVRAQLYDVSSGTAVFLQNVVLTHIGLGCYSGNYTPGTDVSVLVIGVVYTDGTYTTVDSDRGVTANLFQVVQRNQIYSPFCFGAFDQNTGLSVAGSIYDLTTGAAVLQSLVGMTHVALGVYLGSFVSVGGHTYQVVEAVYTDGTYATPNTDYSPGSDTFYSLVNSDFSVTLEQATLDGTERDAILEAESGEAVLVAGDLLAFLDGAESGTTLVVTDSTEETLEAVC